MATLERAIIVGGGVGGLATALALRRQGIDAAVFEQSRDLGKVAVRVLKRMLRGPGLRDHRKLVAEAP